MTRALPFLVVALLLAGCGGSSGVAVTTNDTVATTGGSLTTTTGTKSRSLEVFLLDPSDHKLVAALRDVGATEAVGAAALRALSEDADSEVPPNLTLKIVDGDAQVMGSALSPAALAQVVYTLTQFPTVKTVNGKTRADVEGFAPQILVEHPTADEAVTSPLRVTGNANTFEATFEYELKDASGTVLAHHFVTATSGSGQRGTFEFTIPFSVTAAQDGTLVVFESSAENGSRIHVREIPLRLSP
jgi:hypothetical protein